MCFFKNFFKFGNHYRFIGSRKDSTQRCPHASFPSAYILWNDRAVAKPGSRHRHVRVALCHWMTPSGSVTGTSVKAQTDPSPCRPPTRRLQLSGQLDGVPERGSCDVTFDIGPFPQRRPPRPRKPPHGPGVRPLLSPSSPPRSGRPGRRARWCLRLRAVSDKAAVTESAQLSCANRLSFL